MITNGVNKQASHPLGEQSHAYLLLPSTEAPVELQLFPVSQGVTNLQCLPAGTADFGALDALKTSSSSSSSCTSVLQAAMMVPDLSTFVTTAQVGC